MKRTTLQGFQFQTGPSGIHIRQTSSQPEVASSQPEVGSVQRELHVPDSKETSVAPELEDSIVDENATKHQRGFDVELFQEIIKAAG